MHSTSQKQRRDGALIVYGAISLFVLLAFGAMAIDVAYMQLVRTELRTATDAASVAGCEALGRLQSRSKAIKAAKDAAEANFVARDPLKLHDDDIQIGNSSPDASGLFQFTPITGDSAQINAVQVDGRRDQGSESGRVRLFMGAMLNTEFFEPRMQTVSTSSRSDVAIVLDRSGSMNGDKLDDLKDAMTLFFGILNQLPTDSIRCSLTTYNEIVTRDVAITGNFPALDSASQAMSAGGNTNIGDALRIGATTVLAPANGGDPGSRTFASKVVILLTDGNNTVGHAPYDIPAGGSESAVTFCQSQSIPVYTIAFGGDADGALMLQIASDTGGFFRDANNGADLDQAFRDIASQIAITLVQ